MQVTYIDHMGSDDRVVDAARVSFHKEAVNYTKDQNQSLLNFLARHNHFTPFTHVQITLREKVPIFVARQVFRSTVGISRNEVSRRYVDDDPEFWLPEEGCFRSKPEGSMKQGSSGIHPNSEKWRQRCAVKNELDRRFYQEMIDDGVAPEQARAFLPQSMYTEFYTTASLSAWARMYNLRSDPHAQREIQDLANMWQDTIGGIKDLEHSWKALTC